MVFSAELTIIAWNGTTIAFDWRTDAGPQRWIGQVANGRIDGTRSGAYVERFSGRANWLAENQ